MLQEDDDPLSNSILNSTIQSSFLDSRSMQPSLFSSHYDDVNNPWGNPTPFPSTMQQDMDRSYISPNTTNAQNLTSSSSILNNHTNGHIDSNDFFGSNNSNRNSNHINNHNSNNITLTAASILCKFFRIGKIIIHAINMKRKRSIKKEKEKSNKSLFTFIFYISSFFPSFFLYVNMKSGCQCA